MANSKYYRRWLKKMSFDFDPSDLRLQLLEETDLIGEKKTRKVK
jgi:hypothetical protein